MPRYLTAEEKKERYDLIFNNAVEMFDESSYGEITMSNLAKKCDIAKGTIFKYFKTKETLFSLILYSEYDKWVQEETMELEKYREFSCDSFIEFTTNRTKTIFSKHLRLVRLIAIKRTILDKNIDINIYASEVKKFQRQMKNVAAIAAGKTEGISTEDMFEFYQAWHISVAGSYNLGVSKLNKRRLGEINLSELAAFNIEAVVINCVRRYLRGLFFKKRGIYGKI